MFVKTNKYIETCLPWPEIRPNRVAFAASLMFRERVNKLCDFSSKLFYISVHCDKLFFGIGMRPPRLHTTVKREGFYESMRRISETRMSLHGTSYMAVEYSERTNDFPEIEIERSKTLTNVNGDEFWGDLKKLSGVLMSPPNSDLQSALDSCRVNISSALVEEILKKFSNGGMLSYRFFRWAEKQQGYHHSAEAYNIMVDSLGKIKQYRLLWNLIDEMKKRGVLTQETFSLIFRRYARAKKVKEATDAFKRMRKYGLRPDLSALNSLLSAFSKNRTGKAVQEVFDQVKGKKFRPDIKTYSILLEGWANEPDLDKAEDIFEEMNRKGFEPDTVAYGIFMNALCKGGRVDDAINLFREMQSRGCHPSPHIYSILIHWLGNERRIDQALMFFQEMKKNGCVPDIHTYNTLTGAFCTVGQFKNAYDLLDEMEQRGGARNARTYNIILHYMVKFDQRTQASEEFWKMINCGCDPDLNTYTMMIKLFFEDDELDFALKAWKDMVLKGVCPGMHTYCALINGLLEKDHWEEAYAYFEEMVGKGIWPSSRTYDKMRYCLLKVGKEDRVACLLQKMRQLKKERQGCSMQRRLTINLQKEH